MWKQKRGALLLLLAVVGLTALLVLPHKVLAAAGINQQMAFQGKVVLANGTNIANGTYNVQFKIYNGGTATGGGTQQWSEDYLVGGSGGITVTNGVFNVNLGSVTAFNNSVNWNSDTLWLSLQVGSTSNCTVTTTFQSNCGGDGEMTPYIRLTAVPYAFNALQLGGVAASGYAQLAGTNTWTAANTFGGALNANGGLGIAGLETQSYGSASSASASSKTVTNSNTSATASAVNGLTINLVGTANSNAGANSLVGLNFPNVTAATNNTFTGLSFGTGYNSLLSYNGTTIINGSGVLQSAGLGGTYSNAVALTNTGNTLAGNGAGITGLSAANIGTGTVSAANGGTGLNASTAANGNILIGNGSGFSLAGLTNNGGLTITNGAGSIGLAVAYGSAANTAAQGNSTLSFTGSGNLTGSVSGTAGDGFSTNTLALVGNPTFSGLVTSVGHNAGSGLLSGTGGLTITGGSSIGSLATFTTTGSTAIAATGTPAASATSSLIQLGSALASGNATGTYLSVNQGSTGTADYLNFQVNGASKIKISSTGLVDSATGYAVGGSAGASTTCGTGNYLNSAVLTGGIITSGGCSAVAQSLQNVYDNSGTGDATITTTSNTKGVLVKAGNGFDDVGLFHVQDASGADMFNINTQTDVLTVGPAAGNTTGTLLVVGLKTTAGDPAGTNGSIYYNTVSSTFRCYENGAWRDCLGSLTVAQTADSTVTNSATLTSTNLTFPVAANGYYTFTATIPFNATSNVGDIKYGFLATSSTAINALATSSTGANAASITPTSCVIVASASSCPLAIATAGRGIMTITGYVQNGATAGAVTFQFAQATATAATSATVYKGASLTYQRTQ